MTRVKRKRVYSEEQLNIMLQEYRKVFHCEDCKCMFTDLEGIKIRLPFSEYITPEKQPSFIFRCNSCFKENDTLVTNKLDIGESDGS